MKKKTSYKKGAKSAVKNNKKRNLIILSAVIAVAILAAVIIILASTSSDSDKVHKAAVLGTWELRTETSADFVTIEFKKNNKYVFTRSFYSSSKADAVEEGTYTIVDGTVTLISKDDRKTVLTYEYDEASGEIIYLSDYVKKD